MTAGVIIETPPAGKRGSYSVVAEDLLLLLKPSVGAAVVAAAEPLPEELSVLPELVLVAEPEDPLPVWEEVWEESWEEPEDPDDAEASLEVVVESEEARSLCQRDALVGLVSIEHLTASCSPE